MFLKEDNCPLIRPMEENRSFTSRTGPMQRGKAYLRLIYSTARRTRTWSVGDDLGQPVAHPSLRCYLRSPHTSITCYHHVLLVVFQGAITR
jgi:hypothetical protein